MPDVVGGVVEGRAGVAEAEHDLEAAAGSGPVRVGRPSAGVPRAHDLGRDHVQAVGQGALEQHEVARPQLAPEVLGRDLDGVEGLDRLVLLVAPRPQGSRRVVADEDHPVGDLEGLPRHAGVRLVRVAGVVGDGPEHDDLPRGAGLPHEPQRGGDRPERRLEPVADDREPVGVVDRAQPPVDRGDVLDGRDGLGEGDAHGEADGQGGEDVGAGGGRRRAASGPAAPGPGSGR